MAYVRVTNVTVLDNPSLFTNPFQFEITFDCLAPLTDGANPKHAMPRADVSLPLFQ